MAQVTLYLPDEIASRLKRDARKAKKSLSAYVAERLGKSAEPAGARQRKLRALYGSCQLPGIEDPPLDEIEGL